MKQDLKWMLLGIFLAVASCWFILFLRAVKMSY